MSNFGYGFNQRLMSNSIAMEFDAAYKRTLDDDEVIQNNKGNNDYNNDIEEEDEDVNDDNET